MKELDDLIEEVGKEKPCYTEDPNDPPVPSDFKIRIAWSQHSSVRIQMVFLPIDLLMMHISENILYQSLSLW
jgi:hypothetical protein